MRFITVGRLAALCITSFAVADPAPAQKPNQTQINAIRQACRSDYQTYCSSVPTGGSAALACLPAQRTEPFRAASRPTAINLTLFFLCVS